MADINDNQTIATTDPKVELASQMAVALGQNAPAAAPTKITADPATTTATPAPVFSFDTVKEKFGYEKPEDMVSDIEQLRALKANPPTPTYTFENEESKKVFEYLSKGDQKEALKILNQQEKLNELIALEVNKDSAAEIVKYGLQTKYKDLTPAQIDYTFKKQFGLPSKPVQGDLDPEEYKAKVDAWQEVVNDKQMELTIEAIKLKPELEAAKSKLVFPQIEQDDPEYLNYKKSVEEDSRLSAEAVKVYSTFTPETLTTTLKFIDKANGIETTYQSVPDKESFGKTMAMLNDIEKFSDTFQNKDGSLDRVRFAKVIHNAINMDEILIDAMSQVKNATLNSLLPDNTQAGGLVRQLTTSVEPSELDKNMRAAGIIK